MADLKYIGKNILNHDLILKKGNVSGSATSTGSFGNLIVDGESTIGGDLVVDGKLTAQEFHTEVTSASIIYASGSTQFGDTIDDTHLFTGSLFISGNLTAVNITADSASFSTRVSNLKTDSGSFSTRVTDLKTDSGSFSTKVTDLKTDSGSFSTRLNTEEANVDALQTDSGSFSTRVTATTSSVSALKSDSGSFSTRITDLKSDSGSFSTRLTTEELNIDALQTDSGSFSTRITNFSTGNVELVSGSATSTGSFGDVMVANNLALGGDPIYNVGTTGANLTITANNPYINLNDSNSTSGTRVFSIGSDNNKLKFAKMTDDGGTKVEQFLMNGNGNFLMGDGSGNLVEHTNSTGGNLTLDGNNPALNLYDNNASSGARNKAILSMGGALYIGKTADDGTSAVHHIVIDDSGNVEIPVGNISGSSTSTGSFGSITAAGTGVSSIAGNLGIGTVNPNISNVSGRAMTLNSPAGGYAIFEFAEDGARQGNINHYGDTMKMYNNQNGGLELGTNNSTRLTIAAAGDVSLTHDLSAANLSVSENITHTGTSDKITFGTDAISMFYNNTERLKVANGVVNVIAMLSGSGEVEFRKSLLVDQNITGSGNLEIAGNISGSTTSTGSFGNLRVAGMTIPDVKILSSSIATDFASLSASSAARDTLSETTSSKILNGELQFTNITGSGHISMSMFSTASFGRLEATTIGGHSPLIIDAATTFTNDISSSAGTKLHLRGKILIDTGSIEGDLHIKTNTDLMRIGKSTNGLIMSASSEVSRFATGSDGGLIDLGFTITDEDGNESLVGDGDGIHLDSNNYWYNNKFYRVGGASDQYLEFNSRFIKYKGEVVANTGSYEGEMYITTGVSGSMFIGKYTGGLPSSGSGTISRFATGSDGSIIDLGFTTTDEDGNEVLLTTGDGIHLDSNNYWYTTGHFKLGDSDNFINWDTSNLTISGTLSGSFSGDGSGLSNVFEGTTPSASISTRLTNLVSGDTPFTTITSSGDVRFQSDLKVDGKLTAQEIHTEIESASIIFTSGSTIFGNSSDDLHRFTGSLNINGAVTASGFTGDGAGLTNVFSGTVPSASISTRLTNLSTGNFSLISGSAQSTGSFGELEVDSNIQIGEATLKSSNDDLRTDQNIGIQRDPSTGISGANLAHLRLLHIYGSSYAQLRLQVAGTYQGGMFLNNSSAMVTFHSSYANNTSYGGFNWKSGGGSNDDGGTELMRLRGSRLGIMNSNPPKTLSVSGDISGSGNLEIDGDSLFDGNITGSGNLEIAGNISGSATSTGSFGRVEVNGTELTPSPITALNNATENELVTVGATTTELDAEANLTFASGKLELSGVTYPNIRVVGSQLGYVLVGDTGATSNFQNYQLVSDGGEFKINRTNDAVSVINSTPFKISSDKVEVLNISGSATSTGSFGMVLGDGSGLTNLPSTPAFPFTGSATISGSFSIDTGDGKVFEVSNETGSLFSVTDVSGVPALETLDDKRTVGRFEIPIKTHSTDFTASAALHGGFYNIVGGDLTCSIIHPDTASVAVGTEFEFFVNSTGRGLLFETQSMGTTQIISKGNKVQLDGRGAHATLKKVDNDVYHLRGDLA